MDGHDVTLIERDRNREFHFGKARTMLIVKMLHREWCFRLAASTKGCVKVTGWLARWGESV